MGYHRQHRLREIEMAVVFMDGFDSYDGLNQNVGLPSKYTLAGNGSVVHSLVPGRFGGQALHQAYTYNTITSASFTPVSSFTFNSSIRIFRDDSDCNIGFMSEAVGMIYVYFNTDRSISIGRSTTKIATSTGGKFEFNVWYDFQIECDIHDTAGRVAVYLNGEQLFNVSGIDTKASTTTGTINRIKWNPTGDTSCEMDWDDIFITDSSTRPDKLYYIQTVPLDADGTTMNWVPSSGTDHYSLVGEVPATADGYLTASNVGEIDELHVGTMTAAPASILATSIVGYFNKTDGATRAVALDLQSSGTTSQGSNIYLNTAGTRVERILDVDPATGTEWTKSGIEGSIIIPRVSE